MRLTTLLVASLLAWNAGAQQRPGSAYVNWSYIPAPGIDRLEWRVTVERVAQVPADYYWSINTGFVGSTTQYYSCNGKKTSLTPGFYMGIQAINEAVFSFFGNDATTKSSSCAKGADCGPGVSCKISWPFAAGRTYTFTISRVATTATTETWAGTISDPTRPRPATIGEWTIPIRLGRLGGTAITPYSFAEFFTPIDCGQQPYAQAKLEAPTGYAAVPTGTSRQTGAPQPNCTNNIQFSVGPSSVVVYTGYRGLGSYQAACTSCLEEPGILEHCSCKRVDGVATPTSLKMPCANLSGVTNCDGELVCGNCPALPRGSYSATCHDCVAGPSRMTCHCRDRAGNDHASTIALPCGGCIWNDNGNLTCGGC